MTAQKEPIILQRRGLFSAKLSINGWPYGCGQCRDNESMSGLVAKSETNLIIDGKSGDLKWNGNDINGWVEGRGLELSL
jgi:hypothetical protein